MLLAPEYLVKNQGVRFQRIAPYLGHFRPSHTLVGGKNEAANTGGTEKIGENGGRTAQKQERGMAPVGIVPADTILTEDAMRPYPRRSWRTELH